MLNTLAIDLDSDASFNTNISSDWAENENEITATNGKVRSQLPPSLNSFRNCAPHRTTKFLSHFYFTQY